MRGYIKGSCEKKCETVIDKATCCGCDGVAIALGLFALGIFIVIAAAIVASVVFCPSVISIFVLIIGTITALFVLSLILKLVKVCISSRHSCRSDRIECNKW